MIQGVNISSANLTVRRDNLVKSDLPLLKKDQVVDATVLKVISKTRAELLIAGKRVLADTTLMLTKGEQIKLQVAGEGERLVLKLVGNSSSRFLSLASLLGSFSGENPFSGLERAVQQLFQGAMDLSILNPSESDSVINPGFLSEKEDIAGLKSLIVSLALKSEKPDMEFFPRLLEKGGLFYESRLSRILTGALEKPAGPDLRRMALEDLKGHTLKLLNLIDASGTDTAKVLKDFSETFEKVQLLNRHTSESGKYLLPFPVLSENTFKYGQLLFDSGDGKAGSEKRGQGIVKVSFFLDMTRLGPLRVDVSVLNREISGRFLVSDSETRLFIDRMLPDLYERLEHRGFKVLQMDSRITSQAKLSETSLLDTLLADGDQVLNIVI